MDRKHGVLVERKDTAPVQPAASDPIRLRINLFGRPRFVADGRPYKFRGPAKALNFLAYLLLHRGSHVTRESLAFTLFPDDAEETARANLRRMLYVTQRALPAIGQTRWIEANDETVQWNDAAPAWLDVAEFERLAEMQDGAAAAVELHTGELLDGLYDDWLFPFRERYRQTYVSALYGLVLSARRKRDFRLACSYANRLLADDPFREDVVRQLLSALYESGDRAGALSAFDSFRERLRKELNVDPMPETVSLRDRIWRGGTAEILIDEKSSLGDDRRPAPSGIMVGRDAEMEQLQEYWSRAARGRGRLVFVAGEAGIGKSRLASELALAAEAEGARVLWGVTTSPENAPFQALADALRSALPLVSSAEVDSVRLAAIARIVPDIRAHRPDLPELPALEPEADLLRLFDALASLIGALARPRPLLLILEDGHWAGRTSASALEYIARACSNAAALLVCTFRTEDAGAAHPLRAVRKRLQQDRLSGYVAVGRLTEADVRLLVIARPALAPRADALVAINQVIKRAEEKHDVKAGVGCSEAARVAELRGHTECTEIGTRLLDVPRGEIDDLHSMAVGREPLGVHARRAADVEDVGRRRREVAAEDLLGAHQLEPAESEGDAIFLANLVSVMTDDGIVGHDPSP